MGTFAQILTVNFDRKFSMMCVRLRPEVQRVCDVKKEVLPSDVATLVMFSFLVDSWVNIREHFGVSVLFVGSLNAFHT